MSEGLVLKHTFVCGVWGGVCAYLVVRICVCVCVLGGRVCC